MEINLRQAGIQWHSDVKTATIDPNGQLGYELIEDAGPVTLKQMRDLLDQYFMEPPR
ncbi:MULTISPECIES: YetF domain-containing protein [Paenibacillus]|uniref:YetF domain-containing protein n=1 Tax=Paenibacillus TaxID=44249 RepID=UPI002FDF44D0